MYTTQLSLSVHHSTVQDPWVWIDRFEALGNWQRCGIVAYSGLVLSIEQYSVLRKAWPPLQSMIFPLQ